MHKSKEQSALATIIAVADLAVVAGGMPASSGRSYSSKEAAYHSDLRYQQEKQLEKTSAEGRAFSQYTHEVDGGTRTKQPSGEGIKWDSYGFGMSKR
jgi:hypothetical protein